MIYVLLILIILLALLYFCSNGEASITINDKKHSVSWGKKNSNTTDEQ